MGTTMNKHTYAQMIEEDIEILNLLPDGTNLEKSHIKQVLRGSIELQYPEPSTSTEEPTIVTDNSKVIANMQAEIDRLTAEKGAALDGDLVQQLWKMMARYDTDAAWSSGDGFAQADNRRREFAQSIAAIVSREIEQRMEQARNAAQSHISFNQWKKDNNWQWWIESSEGKQLWSNEKPPVGKGISRQEVYQLYLQSLTQQ